LGERRLLEKSACFVLCAHPQASDSGAQPPEKYICSIIVLTFSGAQTRRSTWLFRKSETFHQKYRCHTNVLVINKT
jgi:hypothetical protein